jgi:hypothetical protein
MSTSEPLNSTARLDPDGNEIPSDEEEELERIRAELRVNAQLPPRNSLAPPVDGIDIRPRLHSLHPNPAIPHEYELSLRADHAPRSALDPRYRDAGWSDGSILDLVPTSAHYNQPSLHRSVSQHPPFRPNPLPMPLEAMVTPSKRVQRHGQHIIRVVRHASLAGR